MRRPIRHKIGALLLGNYEQHLDHLAPLAHILDIPLLITEQPLFKLAQSFYPNSKLHFLPFSHFNEVCAQFDALITCHPAPILDPELFVARQMSQKKIPTIWIPHGNSDKGRHSYYMEALENEQFAILPGEAMVHFLKEKNAFNNLTHHSLIGNYRYYYFKEHLKPLTLPNKTILYAPSWQPEDKTTLLTAEFEKIALINEYNVIVKPHPNTFKLSNPSLLKALLHLEEKPNIHLLKNSPLIFPILASVDLLISDTSSIAYDFLTFDKPMIFIQHDEKRHMEKGANQIQSAGRSVKHDQLDQIESIISEELYRDHYSNSRKKLYSYTFSSPPAGMTLQSFIRGEMADITEHFKLPHSS